jgi:hypothetical protein
LASGSVIDGAIDGAIAVWLRLARAPQRRV